MRNRKFSIPLDNHLPVCLRILVLPVWLKNLELSVQNVLRYD